MDWPRRERATTAIPDDHPLLAIAAGTGEVLMSGPGQHRPWRRPLPADGGAGALRPRGQLTVRADSGFYDTVVAGREMDVASPSPSPARPPANLIEAIPEDAWTPIPYWMEGAADVAETTYTPFQTKPDAAPVRLIVRRVKPAPGSQLALFATYS